MAASKKNNFPRRFHSYGELLDSFGRKDLERIALIKRFFECIEGDKVFRDTIMETPENDWLRKRMQTIGIRFDPDDLAPFRPGLELTARVNEYLLSNKRSVRLTEKLRSELAGYPLAELWFDWQVGYSNLIRKQVLQPGKISKNPRFDNWYQRRIDSVKSELGRFGDQIDHPILAFELSKGCSMSCWFCGFSSKKLEGIFPYTRENRKFWKDIVKICADIFGAHAGRALCYYGTEPYDNPNYLDFLKDYKKITGVVLCTATAAPLKDIGWFHSLIRFYRKNRLSWPRISVLSTPILHKIHETYTPLELRDVRLLMQMKNGPRAKVKSGRFLNAAENSTGNGTKETKPGSDRTIPQGSIACVSGFLINMVDRTIKLVSPCYATERWPLGYRRYGEERFSDASDFKTSIRHLIDTHMVTSPAPETIISFRDDLKLINTQGCLTLQSPNKRHRFKKIVSFKKIIDLITKKKYSYESILDNLMNQGTSYIDSSLFLMELFNKGLLDETRIGELKNKFHIHRI